MKVLIRKALPEDAADYADCVISCWQSAYKGIVPEGYLSDMSANRGQWVEKYGKALADPGDCGYYCAIYADEMIGFLIINGNHKDNFWAIYLIEGFRGKGFGAVMLNFAINELARAGDRQICLWVFKENKKAIRFYEKHGFVFDGTDRVVDWYGGVPLVELRYALNLVIS
ncbi:MAG: GNAT family N-acetyltransferase [Defluviitaleaceae bacterium]|nr:GNAT family N-acetyltransferase [Defluviitaleaceae bacterium]